MKFTIVMTVHDEPIVPVAATFYNLQIEDPIIANTILPGESNHACAMRIFSGMLLDKPVEMDYIFNVVNATVRLCDGLALSLSDGGVITDTVKELIASNWRAIFAFDDNCGLKRPLESLRHRSTER